MKVPGFLGSSLVLKGLKICRGISLKSPRRLASVGTRKNVGDSAILATQQKRTSGCDHCVVWGLSLDRPKQLRIGFVERQSSLEKKYFGHRRRRCANIPKGCRSIC